MKISKQIFLSLLGLTLCNATFGKTITKKGPEQFMFDTIENQAVRQQEGFAAIKPMTVHELKAEINKVEKQLISFAQDLANLEFKNQKNSHLTPGQRAVEQKPLQVIFADELNNVLMDLNRIIKIQQSRLASM